MRLVGLATVSALFFALPYILESVVGDSTLRLQVDLRSILLLSAAVAFNSASEELVFRGLLYAFFMKTFSKKWISASLVTLLFVASHFRSLQELQLSRVMFLLGTGSLFITVRIVFERWWAAIPVHFFHNFALYLLYGFGPYRGLTDGATPLSATWITVAATAIVASALWWLKHGKNMDGDPIHPREEER